MAAARHRPRIPVAWGLCAIATAGCAEPGDGVAFVAVGTVPTDLQPEGSLHEVSGVAASRRHPNLLWVHDDGKSEQLTALRIDGALVQTYRFKDIKAVDWEDIAIGPGPDPGRDYIHFADIGNNDGKRSKFSIYRVPEPDPPSEPGKRIKIVDVEEFRFRYPGSAPDAETLLVDPRDGSVFVIAKERKQPARVFRYPMPLDSTRRVTLELAGTVSTADSALTGGDVSPDGSGVFLRSKRGVHVFSRSANQTLAGALTGRARVIPIANQGQGEALAVEADGAGLIAISEGPGATIWRARLAR